jgi:hypothetical protein
MIVFMMMEFIGCIKYSMDKHTLKSLLRDTEIKFTEHSTGFNGKCPVCGDSKKSMSKKRFWVLTGKEPIMTYCFNCQHSQSLNKFLKERYPTLHSQYLKKKDVRDILRLDKKDIKIAVEPEVSSDITKEFMANSFDIHDRSIDKKKMMLQCEAMKFVLGRKIPKPYIAQMRVAYDGKFKDRLLIPFCNLDEGTIYCFQGRTLVGKEPKYITNKPDSNTKIFNFYNADPKENVYITEGPVDSFFFGVQGLATSGIANYDTAQYHEICDKFKKRVWCFDNDSTGINMAIRYAENGEKVFCWSGIEVKDINDLILKKNLTEAELRVIVDNDTHSKFKAVMKLKI